MATPHDLRTSPDPSGAALLTPARSRTSIWLLAAGLLLIGLNLRIGVASIGPVMGEIRTELGVAPEVTSLLTTIPVVAFGAFAFLTPGLIKGLGMHRLLGVTMIVLAAGITLRLQSSLTSLFAGTVLVGAAIAIANVVMPAAIKKDFANNPGPMMGLYSTVLFTGASLASGLTVPLLHAVDDQWRPALAIWAIPALVAFLLWLPQMRRSPAANSGPGAPAANPAPGTAPANPAPGTAPANPAPGSPAGLAATQLPEPSLARLFRDRTAWAVTLMMGIQSTSYYAALTWLPTLLQDAGMPSAEAGWMLSYSALPGIVTALTVPSLARKVRATWIPVVATAALSGIAYLGLLTAPVDGAYLWMTLLGLGQGASISLSLSYIVWRSPDARHTGHLSTMAQGTGYLIAGLGPIVVGWLHNLSQDWALPLLFLGLLLLAQIFAGLGASKERYVLRPGPLG